MLLTTAALAGHEVDIHVGASGQFTIHDVQQNGAVIAAASVLEQAMAMARARFAAEKVKVEVPFRSQLGEHGVASGLHAGNGNVLTKLTTRYGKVESEQIDSRVSVFKADTPDEVFTELRELSTQAKKIKERQRELDALHRMRLADVVREKIAETVANQSQTETA